MLSIVPSWQGAIDLVQLELQRGRGSKINLPDLADAATPAAAAWLDHSGPELQSAMPGKTADLAMLRNKLRSARKSAFRPGAPLLQV